MQDVRASTTGGFQSILCAVDFSQPSIAALETAGAIALKSGGRVTALSVADPLFGQGAAEVDYDDALLKESTLTRLQRLTRRVCSRIGLSPDAMSVDTVLARPARGIVGFARKMNADLIVMGTHARRGPAKLFFGSVAEAVLRRAPAPLLVVPSRRRTTRARRSGPVIGAIEIGPRARSDARRAAAVAAALDAPLLLVHVVPTPHRLPWQAAQFEGDDRTRLADAQTRLDGLAGLVRGRSRVLSGRPADEIATVAAENDASLIVLILRPRRGIFGPRQGTTTYQVLCNAKMPVLALPPIPSAQEHRRLDRGL